MKRIEDLATGLASVLSPTERERLGALLATDLMKSAKALLAKVEWEEQETDDNDWSPEVSALQEAIDVAEDDA